MINANELITGNYVKASGGGIPRKGIVLPDWQEVTAYGIHLVEIGELTFDPIPITPEWLERLGFVKDGYDYWSSTQDYFELAEHLNGYINSINCYEYSNGVPIYYIHQLQNLYFALTGQELKLKDNQ